MMESISAKKWLNFDRQWAEHKLSVKVDTWIQTFCNKINTFFVFNWLICSNISVIKGGQWCIIALNNVYIHMYMLRNVVEIPHNIKYCRYIPITFFGQINKFEIRDWARNLTDKLEHLLRLIIINVPILRPKKDCQTQYSTLKAQITYNVHIILFNVFIYFMLYYTLPLNAH